MAIWHVIRGELLSLARALRALWPWLLAGAMVVCGVLAYAVPWTLRLDIGGSPKDCYPSAVFDTPYLVDFNIDPEFDVPPERCQSAQVAYRWAFEDARLRLPGVGHAPLSLSLDVARGQPQEQPVVSGWYVGDEPLVAVPLQSQPRSYHLLLPAQPSSNLELHFHTSPFQAPGDPRALAFAADGVQLAALIPANPAWAQLGWLSLCVVVGYLLLRRWSISQRNAALIGVLAVLALTALLIWQRLGLTTFAPRMLALLSVGYALTIILEPLAWGLARQARLIVTQPETRVIAAWVVLAWLIRALGVFHPQAFTSDTGLHINNLSGVIQGEILFTEGLPARAGGGQAPYPPAQYIMLAPLRLLGGPIDALVVAGNALADSLTILWLWLLLRSVQAPPIAAYGAALVYLFATPLLHALSVGEMANVWGQALVLPWVLALVLWRQQRLSAIMLGCVTMIALLGHSGVFLSLVLFAGMLGLIWLLKRDPALWRLALIVGSALLVVVLGYYTAFIPEITSRPPAPPATTTALQRLSFELAELTLPSGVIGPLLALLGLGGLALTRRRYPGVWPVLLAWWLATLLSWATLIISQQALRWEAFLFPAVALGGGVLLAELWCRERLLRLCAGGIGGVAVIYGGVSWVQWLLAYGH